MNPFTRFNSLLFRQKVGVLIITGASGAFIWQAYHNARTAAKFSENNYDMVVNAIGGFGVELFVAAAAVGLLILKRENTISGSMATKGLITLCLAFGLIAAAQSTGTMRNEKASTRAVEKQSMTGATSDLASARAELDGMKAVPALATAQASLDKLKTRKGWAQTNGCANPGSYSVLCKQVADAQAVIGNATRKAQLEAKVSTLQNKVDTGPKTAMAEGDVIAAAASRWLGYGQVDMQMALAFFQAVVMMALAMGGWHLGLLVYGLDDNDMIARSPGDKTKAPLPHNVAQFPGSHTVFVEKGSDEGWARALLKANAAA